LHNGSNPGELLHVELRRSSFLVRVLPAPDSSQRLRGPLRAESGFQSACRIVSNGDFYPRNLIKLRERVAVVDWGHWAGYRACFVDYLVNVAAFAFIHMWGNVPWQREFVHDLGATLDIRLDDFRKAVCIKSFEQARYWQSIPNLAEVQVNQFRVALKNEVLG